MAEEVPMDVVQEMWSEMGDNKTWPGLMEAARSHQEKAEGMSDSMVDMIESMAGEKGNMGEAFPSNPQDLYGVLNKSTSEEEAGEEEM